MREKRVRVVKFPKKMASIERINIAAVNIYICIYIYSIVYSAYIKYISKDEGYICIYVYDMNCIVDFLQSKLLSSVS